MLINEAKSVILRNDPEEIVAWFKERTSSERSKLAKPLNEFNQDLIWNHVHSKQKRRISEELQELGFELKKLPQCDVDGHPSLDVALFATQPPTELKRMNFRLFERDRRRRQQWDTSIMAALKDRELGNIDDVFASMLATNDGRTGKTITPEFILLAVEKGVIAQPDSQDYLRCLTSALDEDYREAEEIKLQRQLLTGNQAFLDRDAYRLLQLDSDIFFNPRKNAWPKLYVTFSKLKKLDRAKVLQNAVRGLYADHKKNVLHSRVKFIEGLKPTADEMLVLAKDLSGLLGSQHSAIGRFALAQLKLLHEKKKIDDAKLLELLPPVFDCPSKGTPKSAVTLIGKIGRANKGVIPRCVDAMMSALGNSDAEVQAAALKWLSTVKDRLHGDHLIAIGERTSGLAATNRKVADELAGANANNEQRSASSNSPPDDKPEPIAAELAKQPIDQQVPITTHEELIDEIARAIEVTDSGDDAERIFDAVSRLGMVPEELSERSVPVLKSVLDKHHCPSQRVHAGSQSLCESAEASPMVRRVLAYVLGGESRLAKERVTKEHPFAGQSIQSDTWKDRGQAIFPITKHAKIVKVASYDPDLNYNPDIIPEGRMNFPWNSRLLWQRMEAIEKRLRRGVTLPLLAAPSYQGGWIEPSELIDRLRTWIAADESVDEADFILSLMRLSPDGRQPALNLLSGLPPVQVAVLQLAFDADPSTVSPSEGTDTALLNVAAHVRRQPIEEKEIERFGLDPGYVCGGLPLLKDWRLNEAMPLKPKTREDYQQPSMLKEWNEGTWIEDHPVLGEIHRYKHVATSSSLWKQHLDAWNDHVAQDPYWLLVASALAGSLDKGSTNYAAKHGYFDALFDPQTILSAPACVAVIAALASKDNDASTKAIDALCESIPAGRVSIENMTDAMTRVFVAPYVRPKRFAENYSLVANTSATHRQFVVNTLGRLILSWCQPQPQATEKHCNRLAKATDCAPILELYIESLAETNSEPTPEQIDGFVSFSAKGKVATLLKKLIIQ